MNDASKAPLIDHYRMWSYVTEELSALVSGKFPADVVRQSIVRKSVGSWRGRDCRIRKSVPLKPCPAVPRMMPYKANGSRRHKIPKVRYRVENWASYDAALRRRRDLKIWVSSETITVWTPPAKWRRGRPSRYSDIAIEAGLMLPLASGRPWRQTDHAAPFWPASKRRSPRVSPTPSDRHAGRAPHRKMPSSPPGSAPSGSCGGGSRWPCTACGSRRQRGASDTCQDHDIASFQRVSHQCASSELRNRSRRGSLTLVAGTRIQQPEQGTFKNSGGSLN